MIEKWNLSSRVTEDAELQANGKPENGNNTNGYLRWAAAESVISNSYAGHARTGILDRAIWRKWLKLESRG